MLVPSMGRRRRHAAVAVALVCAVVPSTARASLDEAGYFAVADRLQRTLDVRWNATAQRYDPGSDLTVSEVNADMLLVHAVAATRGHVGPSRHDDRARALVRLLVGPEIWTEQPPPGANPRAGPPDGNQVP